MSFDPALHHRHSIRLKDYDYAQAGAYFVTLCAQGRECVFGQISNSLLSPSPIGLIAQSQWDAIPDRYTNISLDAFVVMPNHIHGILHITDTGTHHHPLGAPLADAHHHTAHPQGGQPQGSPLHVVIGAYKSLVFKHALAEAKQAGRVLGKLWQRNYWEHVVRNETELHNIREYIQNNPKQWELDSLYVGGGA